ncbi:odorant receptor 22c isoform X2 [Apis cerana]|uniref:odorant receptor 22c isoform X2 n=1 Tax=Apis cerana TaxID=7461 RepID=UPI002B22B7A7|nr:odorant receptor 22c isoform X2 [Apis cerana]
MSDDLAEIEKKFGSLNEYSIQFNRWVLKPIGAWPASLYTTRIEKIISKILIILCWSFSLFTLIPGVLHFILEKEDTYLKLKTVGPLSHWCIGGFNYAVLLLRKNDILHCIEHIRVDWNIITKKQNQQVMLKYAKIGRYIAIFCTAFLQGGVLCTCLALGVFKTTIKNGNETIQIYNLLCPAYKLPVQTNPTHDIILGTQLLSAFITSSSAAGAFSLATVFASHALGQLNIMVAWINEFVNRPMELDNDVYVNKISIIVEHHLRILSFITHIEHLMNPICFMEMFRCMVGMCMPSYYILAEWSEHNVQNLTVYVMIIISMTCNIFLICYIGEILTEQCKKIGEIIYMTNWYELSNKDIFNLMMIISRSSITVNMSAGKIINMSILTFGNTVKSVFVYLNMLRQMTMI